MARKTPPDRPARDLPGRRARPGRLSEGLSPDEAREAAQNLASFFRLLDSWDKTGAATKPAATPPAAAATVRGKVAARVNDRVALKAAAKGARARRRTR